MSSDVVPRKVGGEITGSIVLARKDSGNGFLYQLDRLGIAAWFTDKNGVVDDCNEKACEFVARSKPETLGLVLATKLVSAEDTPSVAKAASGAVVTKKGGSASVAARPRGQKA